MKRSLPLLGMNKARRHILAACVIALLAWTCPASMAAIVPICTAVDNQSYAAIYDDWIVWEDWRNAPSPSENSDIFAYDLSDGVERAICTNSATQWAPAIHGNTLIWMDERNAQTGIRRFDIYSYNTITGTETAAAVTNRDKWNPSIHGSRIAWEEQMSGSNWDIRSVVLGGVIESICSAAWGQYDTAISGNKIVWDDLRNGTDYNVYCYDTLTHVETPVCTAADDQWTPDISGDIAVWQDWRNPGTAPDIYMKNLTTGVETAVCTHSSAQWNPRISGNHIVWADFREFNTQIYGYNLSTGQEIALTSDYQDCDYPRIWGNKVVFKRGASPNTDIYMTFFEPASYESLLLSQAKSRLDGTAVTVTGNIVTGRFGGIFYMEDEYRQCGIRVQWPGQLALGQRVTVSGRVKTRNGERCIDAYNVSGGDVVDVPRPLCMTVKSMGGATSAVPEAVGANNMGLLVRVAGMVDSVGDTYFYIKDGSGSEQIKVKVICGSFTKPDPGDFVGVTGACSAEATTTGVDRGLKVRFQEDITNYSDLP